MPLASVDPITDFVNQLRGDGNQFDALWGAADPNAQPPRKPRSSSTNSASDGRNVGKNVSANSKRRCLAWYTSDNAGPR